MNKFNQTNNDNIHFSSQFGNIFFSEIFPVLNLELASGNIYSENSIFQKYQLTIFYQTLIIFLLQKLYADMRQYQV